ncbi:unnamed protein product [Arctia plantaginis]|nr:unnamed protein product [Arctia plantaginis]CAB3243356.1 unnamed protein product [Arctia plantaginis]
MFTFGLKRTYLQLNKLKNFRNHSSVSRGVQVFVKKNLLLTNSITSGAFMALGDLVEQEVEIRRGLTTAYDWTRIG